MKRVILSAAATIAGLVALLNFKTQPATSTTTAAARASADGSPATAGAPSGATPSTSARSTATGGTYTGSEAETRFGPVQVEVTVTNGKITSVQAVEYPTDRPRDVQINSYAIPALDKEAISAQSAKIDTISGATYTSSGFRNSLQSALNQAGVA